MYMYIYIYITCRICAVEVCIYVDQLNYTLSLSFGKAVVFTSEYALHFIDCNLFVKLFIDRAPWIQIRLSLRLQRDSQPVWRSLRQQPATAFDPQHGVVIHSLWTNIGRDRHEWMITRTRLCTTVMLFEAKRAAVNQRPLQTACYLSGQITSG